MARDDSLDSIIQDMLDAAADEKAAAKATPTTPIKRNPWLYQGYKLILSTVRCSNCHQEHTISHGLVRHFQHKDDSSRTWEIQMERASTGLPPVEEYLGESYLQTSEVYGCHNCTDFAIMHLEAYG